MKRIVFALIGVAALTAVIAVVVAATAPATGLAAGGDVPMRSTPANFRRGRGRGLHGQL